MLVVSAPSWGPAASAEGEEENAISAAKNASKTVRMGAGIGEGGTAEGERGW